MEAAQYFLTQDGQLKAVGPAGLAVAKDSGWKPLGTDLEAARAARDASSAGGIAKTAASGFVSGAVDAFTGPARAVSALGSSVAGTEDPLADMTGRNLLETGAYTLGGGGLSGAKSAQEFAANERQRATANPTTAFTSTLAGQVVGSLPWAGLAGEAGAGVKGALGAGRAARIAGAGTTAALEGAPLGMVAAQDEAYIQNRQLTGEQALASLGTGALIGFGLGAAGRGLGELYQSSKAAGGLGRLFGKGAEATEAGEAAAGATGAAGSQEPWVRRFTRTGDEAIEKQGAQVLGQIPEEGFANNVRRAVRGENIAEARAAEQGAAARDLRSAVNQMEESTSRLTPEWREAKASNVAKVIAKGEDAFNAQSELAQNQIGTIREKVTELMSDPIAYGERASLGKLEKRVTLAERRLGAAIESGKPEELFVALDTLKRDMGPLARAPQFGMPSADRAAKQEIQGLYEDLRQSLTHEAWGGAATMQKDVNQGFEKWLGTKKLFDQRFLSETGREGWYPTYGADPAKIEPFISGLGKSRNDLSQSIIEQHIASTKELAEALAKAGELTPEKAAELGAIKTAATKFESTIGAVQKKVGSLNQAADFIEATKQGGLPGAGMLGALMGGHAGAAAGLAVEAATNPAKFLVRRIALEQMAERTQSVLGKTLDGFFEGARGAAGGRGGSLAEKAAEGIRRLPRAAPVVTTLELFQGKHATPEMAYKRRVDELVAANANYGQRIRDNAGHVFGATADMDPHSVGAAVVSATKGIQFLVAKLPTPMLNTQSLTPLTSRPMPSRMEIQQFADIWTAVMKPLDVLREIPRGTVTTEQIAVIKQIAPRLYDYVRAETADRIRGMDRDGVEVPIRERMILDTLLDLNGAGEPTFSKEFAQKYGPMMRDLPDQEQAPPQRQSSGPDAIAKRLQTKTDSFLGG